MPKNALFGYFWEIILKNYCVISNAQPQICLTSKFLHKKECFNLGSKMSYLCIFWARMLNTIVIFEMNTLKFVKFQNFAKKQNYLILGRKKPCLGFWGKSFKNICPIWSQLPKIWLIAKFSGKTKYLNLGQKMPYLDIFDVEFGKNIAILENITLKLVELPVSRKSKIAYLGNEKCLVWVF